MTASTVRTSAVGTRARAGGLLLAALLALLLGACSGRSEVAILATNCAFGTQEELGVLDGSIVHDLAAVATPEGARAAWSEASGLYVASLGHDGVLLGAAERIGPPCPGGVDAAMGSALLVACGQPANPDRGERGRVLVYALRDGAWSVRERLEPMGDASRGVAIAADASRFVVAWQSASETTRAVWAMTVTGESAVVPPELEGFVASSAPAATQRSRAGMRAGAPSVALADGRVHLAWAEVWTDEQGEPLGELLLQVDDEAPRVLATVQHDDVAPELAVSAGTGGPRVLVSYRDHRAAGRPRGHAMWIPARGETGTLAALSPSNLGSPALLVPCMGTAIAVVPRTHSRHERLVSVREHALDTLEGRGPELQIYEHGEAYEHAAAACLGGETPHLLVLFAARENDEHEPGRVRATTVGCGGAEGR